MGNTKSDILELLKYNGFEPIRSNGKHTIFSDGTSRLPIITGHSGFHRAYHNTKAEIKQAVAKAGRVFISNYQEYKTLKRAKRLANKPVEEIVAVENMQAIQPIPTPKPVPVLKMQLDKEALALCKSWKAMGITHLECCAKLTERGYVSPNEKELKPENLSRFLIANGVRTVSFVSRRGGTSKPEAPVNNSQPSNEIPTKYASLLLCDIKNLLETNIDEKSKERILMSMLNTSGVRIYGRE